MHFLRSHVQTGSLPAVVVGAAATLVMVVYGVIRWLAPIRWNRRAEAPRYVALRGPDPVAVS